MVLVFFSTGIARSRLTVCVYSTTTHARAGRHDISFYSSQGPHSMAKLGEFSRAILRSGFHLRRELYVLIHAGILRYRIERPWSIYVRTTGMFFVWISFPRLLFCPEIPSRLKFLGLTSTQCGQIRPLLAELQGSAHRVLFFG